MHRFQICVHLDGNSERHWVKEIKCYFILENDKKGEIYIY